MFNGSMISTALQQQHHFTNALQAAGSNAFFDNETETHFIQRGLITFAARPSDPSQFSVMRRINPSNICVLNPDTQSPKSLKAAGFRQLMTPASVAEIDMTQPVRLHAKWRNALRKSEKSPIKTSHHPLKLTTDHWLLDADKAQQVHKKFRAMSHIIPLQWPANETLVSTASHDGTPIAAMLFLCHGEAATYQIGWASPAGRAFCAHHRLLHEATERLKAKGIQRLDLGTIDTVHSAGLARFKIGAGASVRPLGGTWAALPLWRR